MRLITFIWLALFAVVLSLRADEKLPLLKVGSEVYSNVTVIRVTVTDINFLHSRGVANAKLKDLDSEMQKRFHYDPAKAGDAQKKQLEANVQYRKEVLENQTKTPAATTAASEARTSKPGGTDNSPIIKVREIYARSFMNGPAPAFVVEKWLTPKPDMNGKFVLIDFWATWCGPCRQSIPHLNKLSAKYNDKMVVVGLSDETEGDVRAMRSPKIDYNVAIDTQQRMLREVEVKGIPHAILLDPKGIVRFEGMPNYITEAGLEQILEKYSN